MKIVSTLSIVGLSIFCLSCTKADPLSFDDTTFRKSHKQKDQCVDIDGNVYLTIKIGKQVWMAENLKVTRYRNGQAIANVTGASSWAAMASSAEKGAWCYYNNDRNSDKIYGKLYNWYAASDTRGLAPKGWHIPSNDEWIELGNTLGGSAAAAGKIKTTGTLEGGDGLWQAPNMSATNSSKFSAVPTGERSEAGAFSGRALRTRWWTTDRWEGDGFNQFILSINVFGNQALLYNSSDGNFTTEGSPTSNSSEV
jgi:uncharacterized protein (TIGR02145 family)